jgi:hypothetical protein
VVFSGPSEAGRAGTLAAIAVSTTTAPAARAAGAGAGAGLASGALSPGVDPRGAGTPSTATVSTTCGCPVAAAGGEEGESASSKRGWVAAGLAVIAAEQPTAPEAAAIAVARKSRIVLVSMSLFSSCFLRNRLESLGSGH